MKRTLNSQRSSPTCCGVSSTQKAMKDSKKEIRTNTKDITRNEDVINIAKETMRENRMRIL